MGRPYGDDLRRKFLSAYDQGEDSLSQLAARFLVSASWAKKISAQRRRTGHAERVPHKPGRKPHADARAQQQVVGWVAAEPDLTLLLDAPVEQALQRAQKRNVGVAQDRFEAERAEFFERVATVYRERAAAEPQRIAVIDAAQAPDAGAQDSVPVHEISSPILKRGNKW